MTLDPAFASPDLVALPAAVPQVPLSVTWHSFGLRSGRRGVPVATQTQGTVSRIIGTSTDTQIAVRCYDVDKGQPMPEWDGATQAGRSMLVALDEDENIVWGGMVLSRDSTAGEWVTCSLVTLEAYLDRRYLGDVLYTATDQATIAAGLVNGTLSDGVTFTIDAPLTGVTRDRTYTEYDDKTVLSALEDLMGIEGGLEFTVDLTWADDSHTRLVPVLRFRDRIGTAGRTPTQWTMPGCVSDFEYTEDYSSDNGANDVMAVSSGQGDTRPESSHMVATDLLAAGWARFERRWTPADNITQLATLNDYATAELAATRDGLNTLTLKANLDAAPRLNQDWWLGDDLGVSLTCPRFPEQVGPDGDRVPGYTSTVRAVGWEIDLDARVLSPKTQEIA